MRQNLRSIQWLVFFLADVQTGLGPFLAACLASGGWSPSQVGYVLSFAGLVTVLVQTPAGAIIDALHSKRLLIGINLGVLAFAACLLLSSLSAGSVYGAQFMAGAAAPFLGPAVAAMTLGITGPRRFDKQFGKNQGYNSAGNVFTALLVAWVGYRFGNRAIFAVAIGMVIPALFALGAIDGKQIGYAQARGAAPGSVEAGVSRISDLMKDRVLLAFFAASFLFHLANAAMLPQLGEFLATNKPRLAAPFMSACIMVTQFVIAVSAAWVGGRSAAIGRKPLLLLGFGVLPFRGVFYTLTHASVFLIAIQLLDGVANSIFGIVSILVIRDRTQGTGRFNFAAGALATVVGIGAALSNTVGGMLIQRYGYAASFLGLSAIALAAFLLLAVAVPETLPTLSTAGARVISPAK